MPTRTAPEIPELQIITSRQNSRAKQLRAAFSSSAGGRQGRLVAIEGEHLLLEALRSGLEVTTVFAQQGRESLLGRLPAGEFEIVLLSEEVFRSSVATESPQGIAALVRPATFDREDLLHGGGRDEPPVRMALILVAAGVQDPGNLGTLVRSAEAFGATGVLALPGTVSAWNQKALRSSAGSTFRLPVVAGDVGDLLWLRSNRVRLLAATMDGVSVAETDLKGGVAVLIGNEGAGLPQELLEMADARIAIPCPGPVESLNAAVAGSLLLYEAARQRSAAEEGTHRTAQ